MKPQEDDSNSVHRYEASGISERHGSVPRWLVGVILVLAVWMVYYLVRFWTPGS